MKLYHHVDRVLTELRQMGKEDEGPLSVDELTPFDQLHYHGTEAVDYAVRATGVSASSSVLEIGSGLGGPARHIAATVGAQVTALELQSDQNQLASNLTARCGLTEKVTHTCGDFLTYNWVAALRCYCQLACALPHTRARCAAETLLWPPGSRWLSPC